MSFDFNETLKDYYGRYFPHQLICNWLDYFQGGNNLQFREFSFTLNGDIYVRYQAFKDALDLRGALLQKVPIKIDVGAIYNMSPKLARQYPNDYTPRQHELVFDVDISDYDDVRNCCKSSEICNKCWPFMKIGAKILKRIMIEEFGFSKLLFVYSGRRGFHCWVCDQEARELNQDARRAIADYLTVVTGGLQVVKRVTLNPLQGIHPMITKALEVIDEDFEDLMVKKQDFLASDHLLQNVVDLVGQDAKPLADSIWDRCRNQLLTTANRWEAMQQAAKNPRLSKKGRANYFIEEVKLQHCYPRLDAAVTKGMNHLLKLPFCIHPKTGNVCVPIDIDNIDEFDLEKVPNIKSLTKESMDPYIKVMKKFMDNLLT